MKTRIHSMLWLAAFALPVSLSAANNQLLGWNNLGMHCLDSDYSVFSILPPYNTIEAQLIAGGRLVTNGAGYSVTYQAVADPDGSFNSTAMGKGNFYQFVDALYGVALPPESGLAGWSMPGTSNAAQGMLFEQTNRPAPGVAAKVNWFRAEGIPITPYDDAGRKNYYPLMRLIARNASGAVIASNDIVLPVSDEMDCRVCHASGTRIPARPRAGWVWSSNPERDYRLNILRRHDQSQFDDYPDLYAAALAAGGFNPQGLYRGVVADGKPVLCVTCHASEALGTAGFPDVLSLTAAIHSRHAYVTDPDLHVVLDSSLARAACYRCHPGSVTRCLRGAMGRAIAPDGALAMQCQSCHGSMSVVGAPDRVGWFMEPNCQSCHTGTATSNNGQIRYTSVFEDDGSVRVATNQTFATNPDTPAPGLSLYRFSVGHGGLQCSACHGSTHAEFPSTHRNDNIRNEKIQGHAGVTAECVTCHVSMPSNAATAAAGPHGMHPIGQSWVSFHHDAIHSAADRLRCAACHGSDFRGTVLSRALGPRRLTASLDGGTVTLDLFQGAMIGCYNCHNGPGSETRNSSAPPVASNIGTNTTSGQALLLALPVTGVNATARIISQPAHGSVGWSNGLAVYFPEAGFIGLDSFTFSAWDGAKNSSLATGSVAVAQGPFSVAVAAQVPPSWPAHWPAPFACTANPSNTSAALSFEWDFGDGTGPATNRYAFHSYATPGVYTWALTVHASSAQTSTNGTITVGDPLTLAIAKPAEIITLSWPRTTPDAVLERISALGAGQTWAASTNSIQADPSGFRVDLPDPAATEFLRLRLVQ